MSETSMKRDQDEDLEAAPCLCGEQATTTRRVHSKDELGGRPFTYLQCAGCGTERVSPRPRPLTSGVFIPIRTPRT